MFEPLTDDVEPKLGSWSAFIKREDASGAIVLTPIWSMHNFQGLTWSFAQAPLRAEGDFEVTFYQTFEANYYILCYFVLMFLFLNRLLCN